MSARRYRTQAFAYMEVDPPDTWKNLAKIVRELVRAEYGLEDGIEPLRPKDKNIKGFTLTCRLLFTTSLSNYLQKD